MCHLHAKTELGCVPARACAFLGEGEELVRVHPVQPLASLRIPCIRELEPFVICTQQRDRVLTRHACMLQGETEAFGVSIGILYAARILEEALRVGALHFLTIFSGHNRWGNFRRDDKSTTMRLVRPKKRWEGKESMRFGQDKYL